MGSSYPATGYREKQMRGSGFQRADNDNRPSGQIIRGGTNRFFYRPPPFAMPALPLGKPLARPAQFIPGVKPILRRIPGAVLRSNPWLRGAELAARALEEYWRTHPGTEAHPGYIQQAGWKNCFSCAQPPTHHKGFTHDAVLGQCSFVMHLECLGGQGISDPSSGTQSAATNLKEIWHLAIMPNLVHYRIVRIDMRENLNNGEAPYYGEVPATPPQWQWLPGSSPSSLPYKLLPYQRNSPTRVAGPKPNPRQAPRTRHRYKRPGPGEHEKKFITGLPPGTMKNIANWATETKDLFDSLYDAIPGKKPRGNYAERARFLWANKHRIDWMKAWDNIAKNHIEDYVFGRIGRRAAKFNRDHWQKIGFGPGM
jgi:hypothetical protein